MLVLSVAVVATCTAIWRMLNSAEHALRCGGCPQSCRHCWQGAQWPAMGDTGLSSTQRLLMDLSPCCRPLQVLPADQEQALPQVPLLPWCAGPQDSHFRCGRKEGSSGHLPRLRAHGQVSSEQATPVRSRGVLSKARSSRTRAPVDGCGSRMATMKWCLQKPQAKQSESAHCNLGS